jgi:hypothetical protein
MSNQHVLAAHADVQQDVSLPSVVGWSTPWRLGVCAQGLVGPGLSACCCRLRCKSTLIRTPKVGDPAAHSPAEVQRRGQRNHPLDYWKKGDIIGRKTTQMCGGASGTWPIGMMGIGMLMSEAMRISSLVHAYVFRHECTIPMSSVMKSSCLQT